MIQMAADMAAFSLFAKKEDPFTCLGVLLDLTYSPSHFFTLPGKRSKIFFKTFWVGKADVDSSPASANDETAMVVPIARRPEDNAPSAVGTQVALMSSSLFESSRNILSSLPGRLKGSKGTS